MVASLTDLGSAYSRIHANICLCTSLPILLSTFVSLFYSLSIFLSFSVLFFLFYLFFLSSFLALAREIGLLRPSAYFYVYPLAFEPWKL